MPKSTYVEINGVKRYESTCDGESLYDKKKINDCITIPRSLLEREIRRIIEEAMVEGGMITDLAERCMVALDADVDFGLRLM